MTLVNAPLLLKANDWPTLVNSGKSTEVNVLLMKDAELLTDSRLGKLASPASRKVMLLAQTRLGKEQLTDFALNSTERAWVTLPKETFTTLRRLLLLILKILAVTKLIPSRLLRSVSVMRTLAASVTPLVKVNEESAGRVVHEMLPTLVNEGIDKVLKIVKPVRVKAPSICLSMGQSIDIKPAAPLMVRPPSIV